jgi:hypothetical protein
MKKIVSSLHKIASDLEKTALDYNEYKKLHPNTKKTPSDPMFKENKPQQESQAPKQQAPNQQPKSEPKQESAPKVKKTVSDFTDAELDEIGFMPSYRKSLSDKEVLEEYNAKNKVDELVKSKKLNLSDYPDTAFTSILQDYKEKQNKGKLSDDDFEPENFYTAVRKHLSDKEVTPKTVREAIRVYHPDAKLTNDQISSVMNMYEKKQGWG